MKTIYKNLIRVFAIFLFVTASTVVWSQGPPPPPPSGGNSQSNKLNGGGAPIGGGLFILLSLGAAYGGRKLYQFRKDNSEE